MLRGAVLVLLVILSGCKGEDVETAADSIAPVDSNATETLVDSTSTDTSVTDAGRDTGVVELLKNGDFELGCAAWSAYGATAEESTMAHGGKRSCRVCSNAGAYDFGLRQEISGAPVVGKTYYAEAWVRTSPDDAGVSNPRVTLATWAASTAIIEDDLGSPAPLDGTWRRATSLLTVTKTAVTMSFSMEAMGGGNCFLIDDASMHVMP